MRNLHKLLLCPLLFIFVWVLSNTSVMSVETWSRVPLRAGGRRWPRAAGSDGGGPGKALRELCEFLSVDFREDVKLGIYNKSGVPKSDFLNGLINKQSLFKDFLMAVVPEQVRKRMKHKVYK